MNPEVHQPQPPQEPVPRPPSLYEQGLNVQRKIMGRFEDQSDQIDWINNHAATFRKLIDSDQTFRDAVSRDDIDDVLRRINEAEGRLQ